MESAVTQFGSRVSPVLCGFSTRPSRIVVAGVARKDAETAYRTASVSGTNRETSKCWERIVSVFDNCSSCRGISW